MPITPPKELTEPQSLCDPQGLLNPAARGWARQPLLRGALPGPFLRRKRWNFVFVSHPEVLLAAALSNADYAGLAFVWLYDRKRQRFLELEHLAPLGYGIRLGDTLDEPAEFDSGRLRIAWRSEPTARQLEVRASAPRMKGSDAPLELRLHIARATALQDDESLNLVVPWSERRYNYTGKLVALRAEGELIAGGMQYKLGAEETLASIDFTRGLWPYHTQWRWACGAGYGGLTEADKSRRIGLNFGEGWSESGGVVENCLYVDGKVFPLWEPVSFHFDAQNLKEPWTLRTVNSNRVSLIFTPDYFRTQDTNLLLVRMKLEQVMGHFSGRIVLENGETLAIANLPGIAENHMARW